MKSHWILLAWLLGITLALACVIAELWWGTIWYARSFDVALGDLDGDGDLDAFLGNGHTDDTGELNTIWLNDDQGRFEDSGQRLGDRLHNSCDSRAVALGDLDDDGDLDAFVANLNGYNTVWLNDGVGRLTSNDQRLLDARNTRHTVALALGDLDGDGDLDAYLGNCCQTTSSQQPGVVIAPYNTDWLNDGRATFTHSGQRLGPSETRAVALGDLDGDGDLDAFVGNEGQANKIWLNDGRANFTDSGQEPGLSNTYAVALGDLDGDGDLDAFLGNDGANQVWSNDGDGHFTDTAQSLGDDKTQVVTLADLDGDGDLDAFVGNSRAAEIWLNDGRGRFKVHGRRLAYSDRYVIALGDLDGDGDLDVLAMSWDEGYQVWHNEGQARFVKP